MEIFTMHCKVIAIQIKKYLTFNEAGIMIYCVVPGISSNAE